MKIVGNDGKEYKTYEEAEKADKEFENSKNAVAKDRKELSAKITSADKEYDEAVKAYGVLKEKAEKIIRDAQAEAYDLLHKGAADIEKVSNKRMILIKEFNEKFQRPYAYYYTGKDAEREWNKVVKQMSNLLDLFF